MQYTKDAFVNARYTNRVGILNNKRNNNVFKSFLNNVHDFIKENKFVSIVFISLILFTIFDIVLVNSFLNLLILL